MANELIMVNKDGHCATQDWWEAMEVI